MGLAALLYIHRVSSTTSVAIVTPEYIEKAALMPSRIKIFRHT